MRAQQKRKDISRYKNRISLLVMKSGLVYLMVVKPIRDFKTLLPVHYDGSSSLGCDILASITGSRNSESRAGEYRGSVQCIVYSFLIPRKAIPGRQDPSSYTRAQRRPLSRQ